MKNKKYIKDLLGYLGIRSYFYWFDLEWWKYLLSKKSSDYPRIVVLKCRGSGHKCGVVWYNPYGLEPNMTCKGCGDDLG